MNFSLKGDFNGFLDMLPEIRLIKRVYTTCTEPYSTIYSPTVLLKLSLKAVCADNTQVKHKKRKKKFTRKT